VSLNFITCRDGFTLEDLVSHDQKHNEVNGGLDGSDVNASWNFGIEGPIDDQRVNACLQSGYRAMPHTIHEHMRIYPLQLRCMAVFEAHVAPLL